MSTYAILDLLDEVLFNDNYAGGIVSYSLEHAQHIYKRIIGHALDTMLPDLKPYLGIETQSAREITFSNGSYLRVDTTLRGSNYNYVLVSEFGKTCARSPQKAEEVVTGTLQAVAPTGKIVIESTGEGNEGYFAEMVTKANIRGEPTNLLDYELFFFPWFTEEGYRIKETVKQDEDLIKYFENIEKIANTTLDPEQRNWYAQQRHMLDEKVKQEYPSTISEAFLSSSDAYYYAMLIEEAYNDNRCLTTNIYDPLEPVYVAMDIGINDLTVMAFFQVVHGEIRFIDYYEDNNKGVDFYAHYLLQDKPYTYKAIFLPHDAVQRSKIIVENTYEREFKKLFSATATKFVVLPRKDKNLLISHAKQKLKRSVFNINKLKPFLDHLGKYRKKWHEPTGRYLDEPLHDIHSNFADCFKYACQAVDHLEALNNRGDVMEKHRQAIELRKYQI